LEKTLKINESNRLPETVSWVRLRLGELFIVQWVHDTSGHQGRDEIYTWARDQGVDMTVDIITQIIHKCETSKPTK